jgi:cytochrome P450
MLQNVAAHGDFIQYPLGITTVYQIGHPALIRRVLQTQHKRYNKDTIQYNTLAQITGEGLLTSDGPTWLAHRRLMQPAFRRRRLEKYGGIISEATAVMLDRWQKHAASGAPLDVDEAMMQLTLEIVGKTFFQVDLRDEAPQMTEAILAMLDYVVYRASSPLALPRVVPTPRNRRFNAAMRRLDAFIYDLIEKRRREGEDQGDVLSMLLQARDEETGATLSDQEIRDELITLLIAGHETVASALTWCWMLLSQHPTVRERMEAEVDEVVGNGRLPTPADLENLPFTRRVFAEALRLYPPAWLITRRAIADDPVPTAEGEHTIAAGSLLILSPYVAHRHPEFWPNPLGFDPDRFAPDAAGERPRFAYIPFGGGPRLCIGDRFALMEAPLIMTAVTQRYRLNLVPGHPVIIDPLVTLRPRRGLMMTVQPR